MELTRALRLPSLPRLAAVGAGGKTSLLFQLARELLAAHPQKYHSVLLTASTHLAVWQTALADQHLIVQNPQELENWEAQITVGLVVISGPQQSDGRLKGLDEATLLQIKRLADVHQLPLLVEADGARLRSLKGTADHEPAIPRFARQVVVCAGMNGLGKALEAQWVHRPERFAELSGLQIGQSVSPEALGRVLAHPRGGLKNIPEHARHCLLLTQADTPELQAQASSLAEKLLPAYDSIVICQGKVQEDDAPSLFHLDVLQVYEAVAGILLAAGGATRFGQIKQLLDWGGKPFVRQVAETALRANLSPVVVVVGAFAEEVSRALEGLPVQVESNPDWEQGQASSIKRGLLALPEKTGAAVFLLVDQPQIPKQLIHSMADRHGQSLAPIIAPLIDERRGNPVLFDRDTFPHFDSLSHEQGGRALFARFKVQWLPWHDARLLLDVDTPEDYQRLIEAYRPGAG